MDFYQRLPKKPYCCDDLSAGLKIRPLKTAISYRYIQFNHLIHNSLIFDIDRPGGALAWEDAVAAPNFAVINRENQHAHLFYFLEKGVLKYTDSSLKALRYLAAVEAAYATRLGADVGYAGLIAKNPINPYWLSWNIHSRLYDLAELADYVNLKTTTENEIIKSGVGRNVDLFENGRKWSYEAVRGFRQGKTYNDFFNAVFSHLNMLNSLFFTPLPVNEVISTAKSISKWTWRNDKRAEAGFIKKQSYKSGLGNKVKSNIADVKKQRAIELKNEGLSSVGIARTLGISRMQVYRYFNEK